MLLVLGFPKCGLPFLCCQNFRGYGTYTNIYVKISFLLNKAKNCRILSFFISGNIESTKKPATLWKYQVFCDY